jgi:CubicO group peptidase (beta-lactamase class C family)
MDGLAGRMSQVLPTEGLWNKGAIHTREAISSKYPSTKKITPMYRCFLLLLIPVASLAQTNESARLQQFLSGQHEFFQFNGNIIVAKAGKVLYQDALGVADYATAANLTNASAFDLASLSMPFTAMAIMICKDRGLLSYEDNLQKFFPDLPYQNITVRQLLTHSSGLPSYENQFKSNWSHTQVATNADVIRMLEQRKDSLLFKPGTKVQFSKTGYVLLASIVEKVSKMDFGQFLTQNIFQPLAMTQTSLSSGWRSAGKYPSNYALGFAYSDSLKGYELASRLPMDDYLFYLDRVVGDGGISSTSGDLLKWSRALKGNHLVSKATLDEMLSPLVPRSAGDTSTFYGFGLIIQPHTTDGKLVSASGNAPGYRSMMTCFMDKDQTIILLSNNEFQIPFINAGVESILAGEELIMPYHHQVVKIDTSLLSHYVGKYTAGLTLEFIARDGKLYRHRKGTPDIELKPESATKFFYADGTDRQIDFETDAAGKVTKVWFINTGQKGEMKRVD